MDRIRNLHEILRECSQIKRTRRKKELPTTSFRIDERTKDFCTQICIQNGTDLSTFLRAVCDQLLKEYMP